MENKLQFFSTSEDTNVTIRTQQVNDEPWFVARMGKRFRDYLVGTYT